MAIVRGPRSRSTPRRAAMLTGRTRSIVRIKRKSQKIPSHPAASSLSRLICRPVSRSKASPITPNSSSN